MTIADERDLQWPNCLNVRGLGGLPTEDGGRIRDGALIRSDALDKLTEDGVAAVRACGVSRIVDLRRGYECEMFPSPFAGTPLYVNVSVQNPADPDDDHLSLAEIYRNLLDRRPGLFTTAVAAIAGAPPGGVVVHCAGGKDRTGLVVAMALTVAGVSREVIAADYALTEERLTQANADYLAQVADPDLRERVRLLQATRPETMLTTLEHLDERYGGVESYLAVGGFESRQGKALRDRLRDDSGAAA